MEYQATSKYVRVSTRKVRLLADSIRTMTPARALTYLDAMGKSAAEPMAKVIRSALSNAKEKQGASDALTIKSIEVMGGPVMKRWRAVSRGSAHAYKKRMTHIRVVLTDEKKS
ncbi:50S ribosomal protein L22 [Candidatus Gottesmanbacteria bacterium]|nr:50S ribosomal protein L22 [Candidatus Gottesmanbacteria bacterium]